MYSESGSSFVEESGSDWGSGAGFGSAFLRRCGGTHAFAVFLSFGTSSSSSELVEETEEGGSSDWKVLTSAGAGFISASVIGEGDVDRPHFLERLVPAGITEGMIFVLTGDHFTTASETFSGLGTIDFLEEFHNCRHGKFCEFEFLIVFLWRECLSQYLRISLQFYERPDFPWRFLAGIWYFWKVPRKFFR